MKIKETSTITISGATWAQTVKAVTDPDGFLAPGFAKAPRSWKRMASEAMEQAGVENLAQQVILMASQPGFGARREFNLVEGAVEPRIEDWRGGHWSVLMESTLDWAEWTSGSSGSTITVEREDVDHWAITGSFPVIDGQRYEGKSFDALRTAVTDVRRDQEADRLRAEIEEITAQYITPMLQQLSDLESLHGWCTDTPPSQDDVDTAVRILTEAGWSHHLKVLGEDAGVLGYPHRTVLTGQAPEGWDGGKVERLLAIHPGRVPVCQIWICPVPEAAPADWELEATAS